MHELFFVFSFISSLYPAVPAGFFYLEMVAGRKGNKKNRPLCSRLYGGYQAIMKKRVGIIGAGNVGTSIGVVLQSKGYQVSGVCCRSEESALQAADMLSGKWFSEPHQVASLADIVFITTPDRFIEPVCQQVAEQNGFGPGQVVLHTSGAHNSGILRSARDKGADVLSMHPLQTFPSVETGVNNLAGSYFALEGDEAALETGRDIVAALGGRALSISTELKSLYHASACTVCNYFVALLDLGLKMMEKTGVERRDALPALLPLIEGTLSNVKKVGVPRALTGPIDRGDDSTLEGHLIKMKQAMPEAVDLYCRLGEYTAQVAVEKGTLDQSGKERIVKSLNINKNTS